MFKKHNFALFLLVLLVLFVATACSSVSPPTTQIAAAEAAVEQAESMGAVEAAPLAMRVAREKLDEAKSLVDSGDDDHLSRAKRLAEDATVEAQLAEQTARTAALTKARDEAQATIDAMREEAGLDAN
jgi:hypothetical protein